MSQIQFVAKTSAALAGSVDATDSTKGDAETINKDKRKSA
jgi:hypothetical protein